MPVSVSYPYGDGNFRLNAVQITDLQTLLDAAQTGINNLGAGVPIYQYLYSLMTVTSVPPDGGPATTVPASGTNPNLPIDPNVLAWLQGAVGINGDTSAAGAFIRAFTVAAYQIRYGSSPAPGKVTAASNQIAISVAQGILNNGGLVV